MLDLVSLGELLIDFTPRGESEQGNPLFEQNPGGGPANLACAAAKLGASTAFLGKVGSDMFGKFLSGVMRGNGVDVSGLVLSDEHPTSLAFVHLDESGDRSFSFRRKGTADTMMEFSQVRTDLIDRTKYFFFSSVLMTDPVSRETSFRTAEYAKNAGKTVVFDPNLRLNLWDSADSAREQILKAAPLADIIKVSEEELVFLTGETDLAAGMERLWEIASPRALVATLGAEGSLIQTPSQRVRTPAFSVKTVDTTAAGDSFTGGLIYALLQTGRKIEELGEAALTQCAVFANAVGSLTTTKKGAISALPSLDEVNALLSQEK